MADVLTIEHDDWGSESANVVHQEERQGNALQWLTENRQLNDTQLFAHVTSEVQLALSGTLWPARHGFPEGSNALGKHHGRRPVQKMDFGHVEVFPRSASETPGLLSELNRTISAATHAAQDCAAHARRQGVPSSSAAPHPLGPGGIASNLGLQIHSAALDHFIEGFPTYAGLLKDIKREFETTLDRVIVYARDNVQLRHQRSANKAARTDAVDKAYQKAATVAGEFRRTVHKKLIAMEERQIAAERRTQAAKERMQLVSSDLEAARAHVARLVAINQRLKGNVKAEGEWGKKGKRGVLKGVMLGPITAEMERALDPDAIPSAVMRKSILKVKTTFKLSPRNVVDAVTAEPDVATAEPDASAVELDVVAEED